MAAQNRPNTNNSKKLFKRAAQVLVGGVNSPVRSFKGVGGNPLVMASGKAQRLFDADGNAYTDYCLSWGALILGHAHPSVLKAAKTAISLGTSFGATTKPEIELACCIVDAVPSIDQVRFVNSGTEATMSAVRLARGFTKRNKIIKFDGCYHGHFDEFLASAGSGVAGLPASSSLGIPASHLQDTLSLPYNNLNELSLIIERHWKDVAAVLLEPVAGNMGVIVPDADFLKGLRMLTKKYGIVLIFDEVMTGFRSNAGGAQAEFGVVPDLTCLGKIIGGGFPIGAYGGRKDIMQHLTPNGGVYQAGTFAGNPMIMAAGVATLKGLTPHIYRKINGLSSEFAQQLNAFFTSHGFAVRLDAYNGMLSLRFKKERVYDYAQAQTASNDKTYARLFHYLLSEGIYMPPADLESFFISCAHSSKDLQNLSHRIQQFFKGQY